MRRRSWPCSRGADPEAADVQGFHPLHLAAQQGSLDAARVLLQEDAEVDIADVFGNTSLFVAVHNSRGRGDLVRRLRDSGADPQQANAAGQTPVGTTRLIGSHDIAASSRICRRQLRTASVVALEDGRLPVLANVLRRTSPRHRSQSV